MKKWLNSVVINPAILRNVFKIASRSWSPNATFAWLSKVVVTVTEYDHLVDNGLLTHPSIQTHTHQMIYQETKKFHPVNRAIRQQTTELDCNHG